MAWQWVETLDEFIARHGGDAIQITAMQDGIRVPTGWWMLPDGAVYSDTGAIRHDPPGDELERLEAERKWLELAKDRANARCKQIQTYIATQSQFYAAGAGPLPAEQAYSHLEKRRDEYRDYQRQVKNKQQEILRAEKRLGRRTREHAWQDHLARRQQQRTEASEAVARMQQILAE